MFPGEIVDVNVDLLMMNELSASLAIEGFDSLGIDKVFDPDQLWSFLIITSPARISKRLKW